MTDCGKLNEAISRSGYKKNFIASSLNITPQAFHKKMKGISEFTIGEMLVLCRLLNIENDKREQIFLS